MTINLSTQKFIRQFWNVNEWFIAGFHSVNYDIYENMTLFIKRDIQYVFYNSNPSQHFAKKDASLFSVRLVGHNERVKALEESMPCESLIAPLNLHIRIRLYRGILRSLSPFTPGINFISAIVGIK